MISVKTPEEINIMRAAGKRLGVILSLVASRVVPGVHVADLDAYAEELIREEGDEPAFLGYKPDFASRPYPATLCVSVNDEVVHGIPTENNRKLKEGDVVGLDLGLVRQGLVLDCARTVGVGTIDTRAQHLLHTTKQGLKAGIAAAQEGNTIGDIGHAIASVAKREGVGLVRDLGGHSVGYEVHEDPIILNFGEPGRGDRLEPGMTLALEPMFTEGSGEVHQDSDGYTIRTVDGSRSAHFEHTILITESEPEILTWYEE